jgi:hypothetical protein
MKTLQNFKFSIYGGIVKLPSSWHYNKSMWIAACFVLATLASQAQNVNTPLSWQVQGLTDLNTNKVEATYQCTFTTNGNSPVQWLQKGNYSNAFTVQSISGTWPNVQSVGKIVFNIRIDTESGTLTFERTPNDVTATLDLSRGVGGQRLKMKYTITQVN